MNQKPKKKKRSVGQLTRLAFIWAEGDRIALMDAYEHMQEDETYKEAFDDLKELRAYRLRRWGRTKLEAAIADATLKSISEIKSHHD